MEAKVYRVATRKRMDIAASFVLVPRDTAVFGILPLSRTDGRSEAV